MMIVFPNGMTEIDVSAEDDGNQRSRHEERLVDVRGSQVFLEQELQSVGRRLQQANGPTRVGPQRFCMWPTTLRSSQTVYATAVEQYAQNDCGLDHGRDYKDPNRQRHALLPLLLGPPLLGRPLLGPPHRTDNSGISRLRLPRV